MKKSKQSILFDKESIDKKAAEIIGIIKSMDKSVLSKMDFPIDPKSWQRDSANKEKKPAIS